MLIELAAPGIFVARSSFAEKDAVKAAGFWWHGGGCRPDCKGCAVKLPLKVWWTPKKECAARLVSYATDAVKAALAEHVATVAASAATDNTEIEIPAPEGLAYLPYQRAGIAYTTRRPRVLIADEMGLGKTIQALGAVNADESIKTVLVVCPSSLRLNWEREATKWLVRGFKVAVVDSATPPPADANLVIVGYPRICGKPGAEVFANLMTRSWDLLVADEAHFCKNPKAQRTQALLGKPERKGKTPSPAVAGLVDRARRAIFLTGTPILNKPIEAHPLLAALDFQQFGNFMGFAKRYCAAHQEMVARGKMVWNFDGASHLDELQEKLRSSVMVRRLKADVLTDLPAKRRQIVVLPTNGSAAAVEEEARLYARREERLEQLALDIELAHAAGDAAAYARASAALTAERGIAFTEISAARHRVALSKVDASVEHIQGMLDEGVAKVIVFAHHHDVVVAALRGAFGGAAVALTGETPMGDRQAAVDRFQTDEGCTVFIGSIAAAGVGLTLTAASHVVFVELDWVPANVSQCEDRAHRIGQKDSVLVQHLVVDGSLDARMVELLVEKQRIADAALDDDTSITVPVVPAASGKRAATEARPKKYPVATETERAAAMQAMRVLAGMCDGAVAKDEMGFNAMDTYAGHKLAGLESFTDGQVWFATKLARKYRRQLPQALHVVLKLDEKAPAAAQAVL